MSSMHAVGVIVQIGGYGAFFYFSFVVIRSLGYRTVDGYTIILFGGESVGV